ncbi:MAG TPA: hypothetical protein VGB94_03460 [Acidobacteriaceae bacterium]
MNTKTEIQRTGNGEQAPAVKAQAILLVTSMAGAANCAAALERQLKLRVQVASSAREAVTALRQQPFAVVVMDESMAGADSRAADSIWQQAGGALLMQVNFAISGSERLVREVRAALARGTQQQTMARRAAAVAVESELKSAVTGIMLESELALREPAVSPNLETKLRRLVELAASLRERLQAESKGRPGHGDGL